MTSMIVSSLAAEIAGKHGLKRSGSRWAGPCPECGGSKGSDRFSLWEKPDGFLYKCFSCEFKGDALTWLRKVEGKSCPDAHEQLGRECRAASCPQRGTCRFGDGSGTRPARRAASVRPPAHRQASSVPEVALREPSAPWQSWAADLVAGAMIALQENVAALAWLAKRGIDRDQAARCGLGWLDHDRRVDRASLGLPPEKNGKTKLWIPGGLVIPIMAEAGHVHRLRIRRTNEAREKFLPDLKYVWIEGSGTAPLLIRNDGSRRGVVIVEAELDAMAAAGAHTGISAIAVGTVSGGLSAGLRAECAQTPTILVALDADTGKDGAPGPGPKAVRIWLASFRQARFWPVPSGKDPGEFAESGGDLYAWIEAGLAPNRLPAPPRCQDQSFGLDEYRRGDEGRIPVASKPPAPVNAKAQEKRREAELIAALPELTRATVETFAAIMDGHPVTGWLSHDGLGAGLHCSNDLWKKEHAELYREFCRLFWSPAHEAICDIWGDRFRRTAELIGKA